MPQPIPTSTSSQSETVSTGATFDGRGDLIDIRSALSAPSASWQSDEYLAWSPFGRGHALEEIGAASSSKTASAMLRSSNSSKTIFTTPAIQVQFPFGSGYRCTGNIAYRSTSTGTYQFPGQKPQVDDGSETWNADGSYVRDGGPEIISPAIKPSRTLTRVDSDGSALIEAFQHGVRRLKETIGVPVRRADGAYAIPVSFSGEVVSPGTGSIPDWYPGGGMPPSPLVSSVVVDSGAAPLPVSCGVPRSIATSGEKIVTNRTQFDPTGLASSLTDATYYTAGVGMVCEQLSSRSRIYFVELPKARLIGIDEINITRALHAATQPPPGASAPAASLAGAPGPTLAEALQHRIAGLRATLLERTARLDP